MWGIEFNFVLVLGSNYLFLCAGSKLVAYGPKLTCFWCVDRLTCFLCRWSKLTWFLDVGRVSIGSSASIEIGFVLVWVVDIDFFSVLGSMLYNST